MLSSRTGERRPEFEVKEGNRANMLDTIVTAETGVKPDSLMSHAGREGKVVAEEGNRGEEGGTEPI